MISILPLRQEESAAKPRSSAFLMASKEERLARRVERKLVQATMQFSGPLPPPGILAQYNDVCPNGAERIIAMAEKQQEHSQELERSVVHRSEERRVGKECRS